MNCLIILPNDSYGLLRDAIIIEDIIKKHMKVYIINKNEYTTIKQHKFIIKIFIEHISPDVIKHIPSNFNIYIPNVEMLVNWDVEYIKHMNYIFCKNKFSYDFFSNMNIDSKLIYTKFTSVCQYKDTKKDYNLVGHFAGKSFLKNTYHVIKYWIENNCFTDINSDLKLIVTKKFLFNFPLEIKLQKYIETLDFKKIDTFYKRNVKGLNYKNVYIFTHLEQEDLDYFADKVGITLCPSMIEGYGHYINEARCRKSVIVTLDKQPMNEMTDNKLQLIRSNKNLPLTDVFNNKWLYKNSNIQAHLIDKNSYIKTLTDLFKLPENELIKLGDVNKQQYDEDKEYFINEIEKFIISIKDIKMARQVIPKIYVNTDNYEYYYDPKLNKYTMIHPKLEVKRKKLIEKLFKKFYDICIKYDNSIKKHKTDTYITLFCWKNLTDIDPVIPYRSSTNNYDYEQLKVDIKTLGLDPDKILEELNIPKLLKRYMKKFHKVYKSIDKNKKINIKNEHNKLTYKKIYSVEYTDTIKNKFNKFYDGKYEKDKHILYFCILYRYSILSAGNQQLAMASNIKQDFKNDFNIDIELYGSCINRYYSNYCSLFYDIEKYFGSLGNFNDIKPVRGMSFANPPFDEDIMAHTSKMMVSWLDEAEKNKKPLGFVMTVPVWDAKTQRKIAKICNIRNVTDIEKYECRDILYASKYLYKEYVFCKKDFPYYIFTENRFIYASNTYMFIVKNSYMDFDLHKIKLKNYVRRIELKTSIFVYYTNNIIIKIFYGK